MAQICLKKYNLKYLIFSESTQAEKTMSGYKELIENQNLEIKFLHEDNCRLEKEREKFADENLKLSIQLNKMKAEFSEKNSQLVLFV